MADPVNVQVVRSVEALERVLAGARGCGAMQTVFQLSPLEFRAQQLNHVA